MAPAPGFIKAYRHKRVRTFKVGEFRFVDHILKLKTEAEVEKFEAIYATLPKMEQVNIVEVLQLENERPIRPRRIDGPVGTNRIVDSKESNAVAPESEEAASTTSTDGGHTHALEGSEEQPNPPATSAFKLPQGLTLKPASTT